MTVHQIRPDSEDSFTPITAWTLPEIYHRSEDAWPDLDVVAGHSAGAGYMIRLNQRELSPMEALDLALMLGTAAQWIARNTRTEDDRRVV